MTTAFRRRKLAKPKKLGMTWELTAELLEQLFKKRDELLKEYAELGEKNKGRAVESLEMIPVRQQLEKIEAKIGEARDWYGLTVLEGLHEESRTLKWLTIVLIALTVVLTIFTGLLVSGTRIP